MTARGLGNILKGQPIATWRGHLIGFVVAAGVVVFMMLYSRGVIRLSMGWYWTVFGTGLVALLVVAEISQRLWDRPKPPPGKSGEVDS